MGRQLKYTGKERAQIAALIREHGVRGTRAVHPSRPCVDTLSRIAREYGIPLKKGRRRFAA